LNVARQAPYRSLAGAGKGYMRIDGKIFDSEGLYVACVRADAVYDLSSNKLDELRMVKISTTLPAN